MDIPAVSWEHLILGVIGCAVVMTGAVVALVKTIQRSYTQIVDAQSKMVGGLGTQNEMQATQIGALQAKDLEKDKKIADLETQAVKDRAKCEHDMMLLEDKCKSELDQLMSKVRQCPVLMGEAPPGRCPIVVPDTPENRSILTNNIPANLPTTKPH
jgi:hypothetical protein